MPSPLVINELILPTFKVGKVLEELAQHEAKRPDPLLAKASKDPRLQHHWEVWCEKKRSLLSHLEQARADEKNGWVNVADGKKVTCGLKTMGSKRHQQARKTAQEILVTYLAKLEELKVLEPNTPEYRKVRDQAIQNRANVRARAAEDHVEILLPDLPAYEIITKPRAPLPPHPDPVKQAAREKDRTRLRTRYYTGQTKKGVA